MKQISDIEVDKYNRLSGNAPHGHGSGSGSDVSTNFKSRVADPLTFSTSVGSKQTLKYEIGRLKSFQILFRICFTIPEGYKKYY